MRWFRAGITLSHVIRRWLIVTVLVAACGSLPLPDSAHRALGPGERWLPLANWTSPVPGERFLCTGTGVDGDFRLHGAPVDPRMAWMIEPDGARRELGWPPGYSARFTPRLEVLDETGRVVGLEGSPIIGGCLTADTGVLSVDLGPLPSCRPCPDPDLLVPTHPGVISPPDRHEHPD